MKYNSIKIENTSIVCFLLFLIIFIFPSPIINYFLFPGSYLSILAAIICVILLARSNFHIGFFTTIISLALLIYCIFLAVIIQNTIIVSLMLGLPLTLIIYSLLGDKINHILNGLSDAATIFFTLGTVCIILSLIYAYLGGKELFIIENPDGRFASFYLSSLSNSKLGDIIRPSFIYDEPGAYSFYLSFVALSRVYLNKNKWVTLILLYGSLVTFSLTHLIICILFTIKLLNKKQLLVLLGPLILIFVSLLASFQDELGFFINRLNTDSVHENNRTVQLENFKRSIDRNENILLYGNLDCLNRINSRCIEDGDISSSPATPIYRLGTLGLIIQLSFFMFSIWNFRQKNCLFIAIILNLLLLQRPFYTSIYYSFSIFILIYCLFNSKSNLTSKDKNLEKNE